jgi:hypothetical protein
MRNRGSTLIVTLLLLILFLGMALTLVSLGVENERSVRSTVFTSNAFYLAEAGIGASQSELGLGKDLGNDGLGTISKSVAGGSYQSVATPRGNGEYDVVSTGSYNGFTARVGATLVPSFSAIAPLGPFGISQAVPNSLDLSTKLQNNNLRIDGGILPAITVQDASAYSLLLTVLAKAIDTKKLSPTVFTGSPLVPVATGGGTVYLPIENTPHPPVDVPLLEALRTELFTNISTTLIPAANNVINNTKGMGAKTVWGTTANPQITVLNNSMAPKSGTRITGNGTLIITGSVTLNDNVSLDWTGDVFLMPTVGNTLLTVNGGNLHVAGNLVSIESTKGQGVLAVQKSSSSSPNIATAVVDGTLQVLNGPLGKQTAVQVMQGGRLTVNGLLSMTGEKTQMLSKDAGTQLIVNGTAQMGALSGSGKAPVLNLDITSTAYFNWNKNLVDNALQNLSSMLKGRNLAIYPQLLGYAQRGWHPLP